MWGPGKRRLFVPLKGDGFPEAMIVYEDLKYPDMVWVELSWTSSVTEQELNSVHRALQQKYKANFPLKLRNKNFKYAHSYTFMGVRTIGEKEAKQHTIYLG